MPQDLRIQKTNLRVSPADQFEALAFSIAVGDCINYGSSRAKSYMKASHAIPQE